MKNKYLLAGMLCFILVFSGCSDSVKTNAQDNQIQKKQAEEEKKELNIKNQKDTEEALITLYFGDSSGALLKQEKRLVDREDIIKDTPMKIVEELMKGPNDVTLFPTIPKGTKLLSAKKENDTITVNFSKEFRDNHNGGSAGETLTIYSIVNSLTEMKDVEKVIFNIDGKLEKEFKGHYEFDKPFVRDESLVKTETQN